MSRPWPKRSAWPRVGKKGRRSYQVGFYDHDRVERTRTFPTVRHARAWMDDYITAERRGRDSLRRFLLDLDAKEANEAEGRTIARVLELFMEIDAHPRNEEGVAPTTYALYKSVLNCHLLGKPRSQPGNRRKLPPADYAVAIANTQARDFNEPHTPRAWREQMREAGVPAQTRLHAWRVLSSALSWAARSPAVPEIHTNGCKLAREPIISRRRSARTGGTGYTPATRTRPLPSWALSPQAVEAIRAQMLLRPAPRKAILAHRDATIVSLQYGMASRNQELWGLRWSSLDGQLQKSSAAGSSNSGARPSAAPNAAPPYPTSCEKTSSNGGKSSHKPDTQPARMTSSSRGTSPTPVTEYARPRQPPATSASPRQRRGARTTSRQRCKPPRSARSSRASSVLPRMRCAAAASPCDYVPKTHKSSPASAAPA